MGKIRDTFIPPIVREWAKCPYCGRKAVLYDNTANSNGIWHKCKECRREFEIRIENGKQITDTVPENHINKP